MFASINKYLAVMVLGFKQQLAYKKDYFFSLVFRILSALIMISVWSAVYLNSKATTIGGFTLPEMYVYFFLVNAISIMSYNEPIAENIQDDIQSGTVTTALVRPMAYTTQIFFNSLANNVFAGLSVTLPFLILASFFAHFVLSPLNILFFVAEIVVSFSVSTLLFFLVGTTAIRLVNIWGMIAITESIYYLLGGAIMPLNLLPSGIGNLFMLLPMQLALYTPAATLLGLLNTSTIINSLIVGVLWTIALFVISVVWWRRVSTRITSVGG